ncbi:MAG TPA: HD domain-containing protein [Armatimonadetes bacterium]|nr:HD domain-containing protein [Armatimonadota bacterium]
MQDMMCGINVAGVDKLSRTIGICNWKGKGGWMQVITIDKPFNKSIGGHHAERINDANSNEPVEHRDKAIPPFAILVEDDEDVAELCKRVLQRLRFRVWHAKSIADAKKILEEQRFGLAVIDLVLPDGNGLDLLEAMRAENPTLTTVIITGHPTRDHILRALQLSCEAFLIKTFTANEFYVTIQEAIEKASLKREVSRLQSLLSLYRVSEAITATLDLHRLLELILEVAVTELHASSGSIMLLNRAGTELTIAVVHGLPKELIGKTQPISKGIAGLVVRTQQPIMIAPGITPQPQVLPMLQRSEIVSSISFPLISEGRTVGVLNLNSAAHGVVFRPSDLELLSVLCAQAGTAIVNAQLHEQVRTSYLGAIRSLVQAIEARDPYTKGHSEKVAEYAQQLGQYIHLSDGAVEALQMAGLLHDVGKIGVPDSILLKPSRLTDEEYEQIKKHPVYSSRIIEPVPFPWDIMTPVYHHHERYDGDGYPAGLRGDDIPLAARVVAVADTFDAVTSNRAYRKGMPVSDALALIEDIAGSQLDSELARAFVDMIKGGKVKLSGVSESD